MDTEGEGGVRVRRKTRLGRGVDQMAPVVAVSV
jgi:hypothetical protein